MDDGPPPPSTSPQLIVLGLLVLAVAALAASQVEPYFQKRRKSACITNQKFIEDCFGAWEAVNSRHEEDTSGYAALTRKTGRIFATEGLSPLLVEDSISKIGLPRRKRGFICPATLEKDFDGNIDLVPDDPGPTGFGGYLFVLAAPKVEGFLLESTQLQTGTEPVHDTNVLNRRWPSGRAVSDLIGLIPPFRATVCTEWGTKFARGEDGRRGSRHSDRW